MKTTLDIDDDLLRATKALALRQRTTMKAVVEHALRRELQPTAAEDGADFIEVVNGLPRLKRRGKPRITSEMIYKMLDEEGV